MSAIEIEESDDDSLLVGYRDGDVSASIYVDADAQIETIEDVVETIRKETEHTLSVRERDNNA